MTMSRRLGLGAAALAGLAAIAGTPYRHAKGRINISRTVRADGLIRNSGFRYDLGSFMCSGVQ